MPWATERSRGTGPRATKKIMPASKNATRTVGRGPVPRHASVYRTIAGDRPPRYEKNNATPLYRSCAGLCGSGVPAPDPVVIRRSQTTEAEPPLHRRARACPSPCLGLPNARGGQAPALRVSRPSSFHRRAWALACHTRMRAGSPRQRPRNPTLAGDRPPRYDTRALQRSRGTGPRATVKGIRF